ncbi:Fc.00g047140.m01.CDS01 [Cosmosporella sp. VM-42]
MVEPQSSALTLLPYGRWERRGASAKDRQSDTDKALAVALCSLFNLDDALNHVIEFTSSEQTLRSISVDDRLTIVKRTTEWGALTGLFLIDSVLISWLRAKATTPAMLNPDTQSRFNHERLEDLLDNQLAADTGATYAKELYLSNFFLIQPLLESRLNNLSRPFNTIPIRSRGPYSVKVVTHLKDLQAQSIPIDRAYLVSCTNSRSSDIAAASTVFRAASKDGVTAKIVPGVNFHITAASLAEQQIAEDASDWKALDAGAQGTDKGCAKAYLSSPEIVAASALKGVIAGPGWYQKHEGVEKVIIGEGTGDHVADKALSIEYVLDKILAEPEAMTAASEKDLTGSEQQSDTVAARFREWKT